MTERKQWFEAGGVDWQWFEEGGVFPSYAEPPFEDDEMLKRIWGRKWGVSDEVGTLRVVLVHRPREEEIKVVTADAPYNEKTGWRYDPEGRWIWPGKNLPDLPKIQEQHDALLEIIRNEGIEVINLDGVVPPGDPGHTMACMARDYAVAVKGGVIVCRMGRKRRRGEEALVAKKLGSLGVPILRTIHGTGVFEGGSFILLNQRNAVVGGTRVNEEGVRQVEEVLRVLGINLIRMPTPDHQPHIDGHLGMVGKNLALVKTPEVSHEFLTKLKDLGIKIIPTRSFEQNVLVLRPGKVLTSNMSDETRKALEKEGIEVVVHDMLELGKALGGPRCSTCPLMRDPA